MRACVHLAVGTQASVLCVPLPFSLCVWCLLYVQLSKVQERLAADLDTVGAASVTRHSAVTIQLNATLDGLSAMTEQLANLTSRLVGLEQQVAHLQDSNSRWRACAGGPQHSC